MIVNNVAVEIEGMDKTGKDTLSYYLKKLGNYAYTLNVRGILTQVVYNDKFGRKNTYMLPYKPFIVFLDVDNVDHAIRCDATDEATINLNKDREVYYKYIELLRSHGIQVYTYNTSEMTPYMIAKDVIDKLGRTHIEDFILTEPIKIESMNSYTTDDLKDEDVFYKFNSEDYK